MGVGPWAAVELLAAAAVAAPPEVPVTWTDAPVVVDGRLDEAAWAAAPPVTHLLRYTPTDGPPPEGTTEFRFLQDRDTLYVGVRVRGSPLPIRARLSPREDINDDDQVGIYLDTFLDRRTGYAFYVTAGGLQQDARIDPRWNQSWNTVYDSQGTVTADGRGYDLEIAIPFRSLRYEDGSGPVDWGLILTRKIPGQGAKYAWPDLDRAAPLRFAEGGTLTGLRLPPRGAGVELVPGVTVQQTASRAERDGPVSWTGVQPLSEAVHPSLDALVGLSPSIVLQASAYPDFSQVESDETPIALNQRFAFSFDEKRPFFLDGAEYLADRAGSFYSRAIVAPVYGVRLTGRSGPWGLGLLQAVDTEPAATVHRDGAPGFEDLGEHWVSSSRMRVRRDLGEGGQVGAVLADKRLLAPGVGTHQLVGADGYTPLDDGWSLSGWGLTSTTADDVERLVGARLGGTVERSASRGLIGGLSVQDITPGHREELGFLTRSGVTGANAWSQLVLEPDGLVDTVLPGVYGGFLGEREGDREANVGGGVEARVGGVHYLDLWADGGAIREEGQDTPTWGLSAAWWGELAPWLQVEPSLWVGQELDYARLVPASKVRPVLAVAARPTPGLQLDLSAVHERLRPQGLDVEAAWRERGRIQWQLTREWGLRLVGELVHGSEVAPSALSSALVSWVRHPGTVFYLGYSERTDLDGPPQAQERTVFTKGTFLLRM